MCDHKSYIHNATNIDEAKKTHAVMKLKKTQKVLGVSVQLTIMLRYNEFSAIISITLSSHFHYDFHCIVM